MKLRWLGKPRSSRIARLADVLTTENLLGAPELGMGYDYHITRAGNWAENDNAQITADEWLSLVRDDPELHIANENGPYFAEWRDSWFDLVDGNVTTKNPDESTLGKMLALANRLRARVQGDDGEIYDGSESSDPPKHNVILASIRFFSIYVLVVLGLSLLSTFVCYLFGMFDV